MNLGGSILFYYIVKGRVCSFNLTGQNKNRTTNTKLLTYKIRRPLTGRSSFALEQQWRVSEGQNSTRRHWFPHLRAGRSRHCQHVGNSRDKILFCNHSHFQTVDL